MTLLVNHYRYFVDTILLHNENLGVYIFRDDETSFSEHDLYELVNDLQEMIEIESFIDKIDCEQYELEEVVSKVSDIYKSINLDPLLELLHIDSPFYDYVLFSRESTFNQQFEKYSFEAYDEHLVHYVDIATEETNEILYDICQNISPDIESIQVNLEEIIKSLEKINTVIFDNASKAISLGIDNTKEINF